MCKKKMKLTNGARDDAQQYVRLPVFVHVNTSHFHTRFEVVMVNGTS